MFRLNLTPCIKFISCFSLLLGVGSVLSLFCPLAIDLLMIASSFILILLGNSKVNKKLLYTVFVVCIVIVFHILISQSTVVDYFGVYLRIIISMCIIVSYGNDLLDFKRYFIKAIWLVMYLAILNFILAIILPGLFTPMESSIGYPINSIGLIFNKFTDVYVGGLLIPRNQGLFWEPGVLQIPTNILLYYLIIEKECKLKEAVIPLIVLFSTFSTTGFIVLAIILCFRFKRMIFNGRNKIKSLIISLIVSTIFGPILYIEIDNKFNSEMDNTSSAARTYDLLMSINVLKNNFLSGIGISEEKYQNEISNFEVLVNDKFMSEEHGNTNTILKYFVVFGFPGGVFLLYALYNQSVFKSKNAFFCVIFISLFSEPLLVIYLIIILMLSSIKSNKNEDSIHIRHN